MPKIKKSNKIVNDSKNNLFERDENRGETVVKVKEESVINYIIFSQSGFLISFYGKKSEKSCIFLFISGCGRFLINYKLPGR